MLPSMMTTTALTRRRFPRISDHGAQKPDYTAAPASTLGFTGSVQPGSGQVDNVNRAGAEVVYTVWVSDPTVDVQHEDLVAIAGVDYQVNGAPDRWQTGVLDHAVVYLSRWSG